MKPSQISMRNPSNIREPSSNFRPGGSEYAFSLVGVTSDVEKVRDSTDQHIQFEDKDRTDISVMTSVRKKSEDVTFLESENQRKSDKPKISFEKDASKDPKDIFASRELRQSITREAVDELDDRKCGSACSFYGGQQSNLDQKNLGRFFAVDTAYKQEDLVRKSIHFSIQILSELERRLDLISKVDGIDDSKSMSLDIENIEKFLGIRVEPGIEIHSEPNIDQERGLLVIREKNVPALLSQEAEGLFGREAEGLLREEREFCERSTESGGAAIERLGGETAGVESDLARTEEVGIVFIEEERESFIDRYRLEDLDVYFFVDQLDLLEKSGVASEVAPGESYKVRIAGNERFKKVLSAQSSALKKLSTEEREIAAYYRGIDWPEGERCWVALYNLINNIIMQEEDFSSDLNDILHIIKGNGVKYLVKIIQDIFLREKLADNNLIRGILKDLYANRKDLAKRDRLQFEKTHQKQVKTIFNWVNNNLVALHSTEKEWIDFAVQCVQIRESAEIINRVTTSCRRQSDKVETLTVLLGYFYAEMMDLERLLAEFFPENPEDDKKVERVLKTLLEMFKKIQDVTPCLESEQLADVLRGLKIAKMFAFARNSILSNQSCASYAKVYEFQKNVPVMLSRDSLFPEAMPTSLVQPLERVSDSCTIIVQFMQYFEANRDRVNIVSPTLVNIFDRIKYLVEECQDAVMQMLYLRETERFDVRFDMLLCYFVANWDEQYIRNSISRVLMPEEKKEGLPSPALNVVLQPVSVGYNEGSIDLAVDLLKDSELDIHDLNPNILCAQKTEIDVAENKMMCYAKFNWEQEYKPQHILRVLMDAVRNELFSKDNMILVNRETVCTDDCLAVRTYGDMLSEEKCAEMLKKIVRLECSKESFYEVWSEQLSCVKKFFIYQLLISKGEASRQLVELWSIWQADDMFSGDVSDLENYFTQISCEMLFQIYERQKGELDWWGQTNIPILINFFSESMADRKDTRKDTRIDTMPAKPKMDRREILISWRNIIEKICILASYRISEISLADRIIDYLKIFYSVDKDSFIEIFDARCFTVDFHFTNNRRLEIDFLKALLNSCSDDLDRRDLFVIQNNLLFLVNDKMQESLLLHQPFYAQEIDLLKKSFEMAEFDLTISVFPPYEDNCTKLRKRILLFVFLDRQDVIDDNFYDKFEKHAPKLLVTLGEIVFIKIKQVIRHLQRRIMPDFQGAGEMISKSDKAILQEAIRLYQEICFPIKYEPSGEVGISPRDAFILGVRKLDQLLSFYKKHEDFLSHSNALFPITIIRTILGSNRFINTMNKVLLWQDCYVNQYVSPDTNFSSQAIHSTVFCFHSLTLLENSEDGFDHEGMPTDNWSEEDITFFWEKASSVNKFLWIRKYGNSGFDRFLETRRKGKGVKRIEYLYQELLLLNVLQDKQKSLNGKIKSSQYGELLITDVISLVLKYIREQINDNVLLSIEMAQETMIFVFDQILYLYGMIQEKVETLEEKSALTDYGNYIWESYKLGCPALFLRKILDPQKFVECLQATYCKEVIDSDPWCRFFFRDIDYNPSDVIDLPFSKDLWLKIFGKCFYRCMNSEYYVNHRGFWLDLVERDINNMLSGQEKNIFFENVLSSVLSSQHMESTALLYFLRKNLVDETSIKAMSDKLSDPMQKLLFSCYFLGQEAFEDYIQKQQMNQANVEFLKSERKYFLELREDDANRKYSDKEQFLRIVRLKDISFQLSSVYSCDGIQKYVWYSIQDVNDIFSAIIAKEDLEEQGKFLELKGLFLNYYQKAWGNFGPDLLNLNQTLIEDYSRDIFLLINFLSANEKCLDDRLLTPLWIIKDIMDGGDADKAEKILTHCSVESEWMCYFCGLYVLDQRKKAAPIDVRRCS